jgi:hypothetical protein
VATIFICCNEVSLNEQQDGSQLCFQRGTWLYEDDSSDEGFQFACRYSEPGQRSVQGDRQKMLAEWRRLIARAHRLLRNATTEGWFRAGDQVILPTALPTLTE